VELGGGIGVVSCLANRKLSRPEQHIVVEANPALMRLLRQNRDLNGCQFHILNRALAYGTESVAFRLNSHFLSSRVGGDPDFAGSDSTVSVPTTSLKSVIDHAGFGGLSLICDIEGAETSLVEREIDTIRKHAQCILVEIHPEIAGEEAVSVAVQRLRAAGFIIRDQLRDQKGSNLLLERQ
jgi:FkbM family methyltransferase